MKVTTKLANRALGALGIAAAVLVLAACGGSTTGKTDEDVGAIERVPCETDAECLAAMDPICQTGTCNQETKFCDFGLLPETCLIEGGCYISGQASLDDGCLICDPVRSTDAFSDKTCPDGATCRASDGACLGAGKEFGEDCVAGDECSSGYCVPTPDGSRCTQSCEGDCPDGWACAPLDTPEGEVMVCLRPDANLCSPCSSDAECTANAAADGARCVELAEGAGKFCGVACAGGACPAGYSCRTFTDPAGDFEQCVPEADGECACTPWAIGNSLSTACGLGECSGSRTCLTTGLSDCDAPPGVPELCDNLDNDCDGLSDEDFISDGQYLHDQHCGDCSQSCAGHVPGGYSKCQLVDTAPACEFDSCLPGFLETAPQVCESITSEQCHPCADQGDCVAGLECTALGTGQFCLKACAPGGTDCLPGFACTTRPDGNAWCLLEIGGCAGEGFACSETAACEDLNPCTHNDCTTDQVCSFTVDETITGSCYDGMPGTETTPPCQTGTLNCTGGVPDCAGQVIPAPDACIDGEDNDCDGLPDDGCEIVGFDFIDGAVHLIGQVTPTLFVDATLGGGPMGDKPPPDATWQVTFGLYP